MFNKILIANRGEIACRVIKTARRMGIATVAVYSDADKDALHVEMADEAVHIGPPAAAESYLVIDKIVAACKADRRAGRASGLRIPVRARRLSDGARSGRHHLHRPQSRAPSRRWATRSNRRRRPTPRRSRPCRAILGVIEDGAQAVKIADEIGYPVMIKASAGGGGKGMRIAHSRDEVKEGFDRARSEAKIARSATTAFSSRNSSSIRATSKSRCSATSTATSSISASANARSSAATRR